MVVLDPFDLAPGSPELVWDPVLGCADSMVAERRAKAFTAGTVKGAVNRGAGDEAARFYAAEGAKVLQAYFHAAALAGGPSRTSCGWLADPPNAGQPEEMLRTHPDAAPFWDGLLRGALHGDDRTGGQHDHDGAAVDGAVLPGRSTPLHPGPWSSRHRPGRSSSNAAARSTCSAETTLTRPPPR